MQVHIKTAGYLPLFCICFHSFWGVLDWWNEYRMNIYKSSLQLCREPAGGASPSPTDSVCVRQSFQRGGHDGLDRVEAVFRLVEDDALIALEDLVRDLETVEAIPLIDRAAVFGAEIVVGRETVHEAALRTGGVHELLRDAVGQEIVNALFPDRLRLAHGDPDVGIEHMGVLHGLHRVGDEFQHRAGLLRNCLTLRNQRGVREVFLRRAGDEVHAHLGAADHEGVAHVIARIAEIDELDPLERAEVLADGEEVGEDLRGVKLVREPVPDAHARVLCQRLHPLLLKAAVFDAVEHSPQHAGGVGYRLLLPDLRAARIEIHRVHAEIRRRHLKGTPRARARLIK